MHCSSIIVKRLGAATFLFFLAKGLVWLAIFAVAASGLGRL